MVQDKTKWDAPSISRIRQKLTARKEVIAWIVIIVPLLGVPVSLVLPVTALGKLAKDILGPASTARLSLHRSSGVAFLLVRDQN